VCNVYYVFEHFLIINKDPLVTHLFIRKIIEIKLMNIACLWHNHIYNQNKLEPLTFFTNIRFHCFMGGNCHYVRLMFRRLNKHLSDMPLSDDTAHFSYLIEDYGKLCIFMPPVSREGHLNLTLSILGCVLTLYPAVQNGGI
jgi:hypothetical protein